jgi:hypothetical protein
MGVITDETPRCRAGKMTSAARTIDDVRGLPLDQPEAIDLELT